jgi:ORF6N domain
MAVPILSEQVERTILLIRGQPVMLDTDLAALYGVPAKTLNQAVRRNVSRFPADFMFQLTEKEATALRSQFVTLKTGRGNAENTAPTPLQNKGWRCFRACCIASTPEGIREGFRRDRPERVAPGGAGAVEPHPRAAVFPLHLMFDELKCRRGKILSIGKDSRCI